jgi:5-(carboxyamino)imidazole ribonucleotide synthase
MAKPRYLPPGSKIGVIGGGQLGRMLAIAARCMGYRVVVLDPDPECPAGQAADEQIISRYEDRDACRDLARRAGVVTYEFENVDAGAVEAAEEICPVFPSPDVLRTTQHRVTEKKVVASAGFSVAPFMEVREAGDIEAAVKAIGTPGVLKTATMGYDGKGQAVVYSSGEAQAAFQELQKRRMPQPGGLASVVYERFVPLAKEVSVICARDQSGKTVTFPCTENIHRNNILDTSIAPARVPASVSDGARAIASGIAERLDVVGLIAVEMFLAQDGQLLVNELAPRPHNSGHWTIEGCRTSQFEQLVRILCGLPMGTVEAPRAAVMVNLLGDIWAECGGHPDFSSALAIPGVSLHIYGKAEARPGRKMGHITAVAADAETALARAVDARRRLVTR